MPYIKDIEQTVTIQSYMTNILVFTITSVHTKNKRYTKRDATRIRTYRKTKKEVRKVNPSLKIKYFYRLSSSFGACDSSETKTSSVATDSFFFSLFSSSSSLELLSNSISSSNISNSLSSSSCCF